ncbi:hypothetical protein AHF37_09276 [Paragonimus kellicotti]|nr:hypothetical protein AHF37_09276 [Paragonimus kellicotti]
MYEIIVSNLFLLINVRTQIRSISPYLLSLAREAYYQETEASRAHTELQRLRAQLDHAHSNTLQRNNEMAEHLASLTDELQELRGFGRPTGSGSLSTTSAKKGSIFYVLKR